jgi:hypothetical protein
MRPVVSQGVAPARTIADNVEHTADYPLIIDTGHPFEGRKQGAICRTCAFVSQNRSAMASPPATNESTIQVRH